MRDFLHKLWRRLRRGGRPLVVVVSGGFDPPHVGHLELFRDARRLGDRVVVILNSDDFLLRKKGYVFMPLEERKALLEANRYVDQVVVSVDHDQTVRETLCLVRPDIFLKSGDRQGQAEAEVCAEIGCRRVFQGAKIQSSSQLVERAVAQINNRKGRING